MAKKVIRLTESDLEKIVKRVIEEQPQGLGSQMSLSSAISNFPNAKKRTFSVLTVKGKPSIKKDNRDLLLTKGMTITPTDNLKFQSGDEVMMKSISPEDGSRYFQQVNLYLNPNGKLEIFVYSD
jgi:transposase